jgi:hypothetical protein
MKGNLLGINERKKSYKCYILVLKKVVTFKDVIINEKRNPCTIWM